MAQSPVVGTGGVTSGKATIVQSGNTTNINQSTQAASINWQSFSIGSSSVVDFNQPSATSVTLNRVIGTESSVIAGVLNATGNVFLLNGNGILMTKGASINTGGFVASTLNISDEDFKAGKYTFHATGSTGSVVNLGTITAKDSGYVALLGNTVSNQGVIVATKGTVALAAGDQITLNFNGNSLVGVTVDEGALNALVENKQAIYADGGKVIMTAKAADDLLTAQVNDSGLIQARTVDDLEGDIQLLADGGTVNLSGTLDASAPVSGNGGQIETSGNTVKVADSATITTASANGTTGNWVIDPDGFTIASNGGDMTGAELSKDLQTTKMVISSTDGSGDSGDLDVNDAVSWSAATTLTLNATNDINVNSAITATGTNAGLTLNSGNDININNAILLSGSNAALAMTYKGDYNILTPASYAGTTLNWKGIPIANTDTSGGVYGSITLSGDSASLSINNNAYTLIHSMSKFDDLDGYDAATDIYLNGATLAQTVSGYYAIAQNLDASGVTYTNSPINSFAGTLTGLGHTISNLTIDAPSVSDVGLIGEATSSTLRDIGLTNVHINGYSLVGALLGYGTTTGTKELTVKDAYSTGKVSAYGTVGGLIGEIWANGPTTGAISYAYSSADVTSTATDVIYYADDGITVTGYYSPIYDAGGLIGSAYYAAISHSDATGNVTSVNGDTGGLAGAITGAYSTSTGDSASLIPTITLSYATGKVAETTTSTYDASGVAAGGLIGSGNLATVTDSFATGNVSGYDQVGGLIGRLTDAYHELTTPVNYVDNTYATGNVTSTGDYAANPIVATSTGGLIGYSLGTDVSNSFATGNVTSTYVQAAVGLYNVSVGGLIGVYLNGTVSNSYATGDVTASTDRSEAVGGLIGTLALGTVTDSQAYGHVTGADDVGGLVGATGGTYWYDIGFTTDMPVITDSVAYGSVSGVNNVGGVVGLVSGNIDGTGAATITDVSSWGNVTGTGSYVGGIAGYDASSVTYSNAYGSVEGLNNVGGVAGYAKDTTGSNAYGSVNSDAVNVNTATAAANTMSNQTGDYTLSGAAEDAATAGNSTGTLDENIVFDDSMNFSATIKTVIVDGVEYQIEDDELTKQKQENNK
jgi:filamentous hemagglutinin family protein